MSKSMKVIRSKGGPYGRARRKRKAIIITVSSIIALVIITCTAFLLAVHFNVSENLTSLYNRIIGISSKDELPSSKPDSTDTSSLGTPSDTPETDLETDTGEPSVPPLDYDESSIGYFTDKTQKIYIFENVGYEIFYGDKQTAASYAKTINSAAQSLKEMLGRETVIYDMIIPTRAEFTLPDAQKIKASTFSQVININTVGEKLNKDVQLVNVCDTLMQHRDEYIFYNTDSFWSARGAYYGYAQLAKAAGFEPIPLSELESASNKIEGYIGSIAKSSKDNKTAYKELSANSDTVEYFDIPYDVTVKSINNNGEAQTTALYYPTPSKEYAYAVFLFGGDSPVMKISSNANSGRNLLVIKDSAGNCMIPYLAANYDEIYVVDYRYFEGDLEAVIADTEIKEVLFLNGIMDANTGIRTSSIDALFK